ncbi:MAG: 50S ribosomal protein L17 [Candidatus Delongbacteria bacterium]
MRHNIRGRKLNRTASHRKALMSNLSAQLFEHKQITTTLAKAKEARKYAEKMITLGKKADLNSLRQALKFLKHKKSVNILFNEIAPKYKNRQGGYTRVLKLGYRKGDAAETALLQLVEFDEETATRKPVKDQGKKTEAASGAEEKIPVKAETEDKKETKEKTEAESETKEEQTETEQDKQA